MQTNPVLHSEVVSLKDKRVQTSLKLYTENEVQLDSRRKKVRKHGHTLALKQLPP